MEKDKFKIDADIFKLRQKIIVYREYLEYLSKARVCSNKIDNGLSTIVCEQYEKVKTCCIDGIGEEDVLLEALKLKKTNIYDINNDIYQELKNASNKVQDDIEQCNSQINLLYKLREEASSVNFK